MNLAGARKKAKSSWDELAYKTGISTNTGQNRGRGTTYIPYGTVMMISSLSAIPPENFFAP